MLCCKKLRLCLLLLFFCSITPALANPSSISIDSAELIATENSTYLLNADFNLDLSPALEEIVNKGLSLTFLVEFQLVSPRRFWFDDEIISLSSQISLTYHALSRQYLVNRDGSQFAFSSIQEAKSEIARIRNWLVLDDSISLKKDKDYQAGLRIRLDQSKLPKALHADTLNSEDWNMTSEYYRWTPTLSQ